MADFVVRQAYLFARAVIVDLAERSAAVDRHTARLHGVALKAFVARFICIFAAAHFWVFLKHGEARGVVHDVALTIEHEPFELAVNLGVGIASDGHGE